MCLIFLSLNQHPRYKLIVAANRDEFYKRQTAPAAFWHDHPNVLGGRDLEASGTWMGVTRSGRISMLTNYRDPANIDPAAPSRGRLVMDYLVSAADTAAYMGEVEASGLRYNGFNLLAGTVDHLLYFSNYRPGVTPLEKGFYGLSNHLLDTPWPKVIRGKEKIAPLLAQPEIDPEDLFRALYDDERASVSALPETGLPRDREYALSSMFIKTPDYGSRCSTVVMVDRNDNLYFEERVFDTATFQYTRGTFSFPLSA